ncbi:MAG TPA: NAD-dependent epimerase/dehydratase family protein [Acidimicrobiales bacterium]|jgi:UDP-glucose 4-epimerase|nr:NAD-dependent epimerase/dehydratase family protein [Acidimicrobiales bacterium]
MSDPWTCLVTGGAGFIGSNLVDALVEQGHEVRVLDDLSTGYAVQLNPAARLTIGSVDDLGSVRIAVDGCDVVFHLAAHRAVLRSVEHPLATDSANTHGTLTVLDAARNAGVRRVVYASSSSVYGGAELKPTPESAPLLPRSPYAVSKLAGEHYCRVFTELYGIETFALRYFNVYGPRQRPDSQYAAVIPLFIDALRERRPPTVHGDGKQSRDFTYISDVVAANIAAANAPAEAAGRAYNIAGGDEHSLLDLLEVLGRLLDVEPEPEHTDPRPGDVRHTCAEVSAAAQDLDWRAEVSFEEGLTRTTEWFMQDDR